MTLKISQELTQFIIRFLNPDQNDWPFWPPDSISDNDKYRFLLDSCSKIELSEIKSAIKGMDYNQFLKTLYWSLISKAVISRDKLTCVDCTKESFVCGSLEVHHLTYDNHGLEHLHLEDLISVCAVCHALRHGRLVEAVLSEHKIQERYNELPGIMKRMRS